jgi:uncharacterized membrane protein YgdD (TMEM256/DUF423 family)
VQLVNLAAYNLYMNKKIVTTAAILGMLAVITGAFGAHALKEVLTAKYLQTWATAVQYHFYHVFALLLLAALNRSNSKLINASYWLFTLGILLFSGSLYALSLLSTHPSGIMSILGPITPLGGLLFIAGWFTLALAAWKEK